MSGLLGNAINIVISVFLMMAIGFVGTRRGWLTEAARSFLSFLIVRLALPCMVLARVTTAYTRATLSQGAYGLLIPLLSMSAVFLVSLLLERLLKIPKGRRGIFNAMMVFSNSVFIGVPIATALFGESVLPHTLLYYVANTTFFWVIGAPYMRMDINGEKKFFTKGTLRSLFSPPLVAFLAAIVLVLIGIKLPKAVLDTCEFLGGVVTPLSLIFIGGILGTFKKADLRIDKEQIVVIVGRFILSPLLVYALALLIPVQTITRDAFLVQAAMPVMTQISIMTSVYGGDAKYATVGTVVTTVLSLAVIPVMALLLPLI